MAALTCILVTPEATALEAKADFVALPLEDGEIGIAPARSPLIGRVGFGELRIRSGPTLARWYVDGGFVQVAYNVVSVLADIAIPGPQIDAAVVEEQLRAALKRPARTRESIEARQREAARARAQLRVARRAQTP